MMGYPARLEIVLRKEGVVSSLAVAFRLARDVEDQIDSVEPFKFKLSLRRGEKLLFLVGAIVSDSHPVSFGPGLSGSICSPKRESRR